MRIEKEYLRGAAIGLLIAVSMPPYPLICDFALVMIALALLIWAEIKESQ